MGKKKNTNPKATKVEEQKRLEREAAVRLKIQAEEREERLQLIQKEIKQNNLRRPILLESIEVFDDLLSRVRKVKKSNRAGNVWKKYIACDPIPDTTNPAVVRAYIYRFLGDYDVYKANHLNWWLECNERSLLIQDASVPNTTRIFVKRLREPTGRFYDQKLNYMMKVYESLDETLRRRKVSEKHLNELTTVRDEMRETAFQFLDALTFEIIMHIDREMDSMTPIISHYTYASADFVKFIWSFKDVTLPAWRERYRKIIMKPLRMTVTMSRLLDLEGTCVRALWFKRDMFSDYCASFMPLKSMKFESLPVAIEREMTVRKYMRKMTLEAMRQERAMYEEKMEEIRKLAEEEEASKKGSKVKINADDAKKKPRKTKMLFEPPVVDDSTYVDVEDEYVEYERNKADDERNSMSPEHFNLQPNDVNMRAYHILGGIYRFECIERPVQTKHLDEKFAIRINERPHTLKYQNFTHIYEEPKLMRIKEERMSLYFADKILDRQAVALRNLTKVEIQLSSEIVWFEPPIVCRWERWEDSDEFLQLNPKLQDYNLNYEKYISREQEKLFSAPLVDNYVAKRTFSDFQLSFYPARIKLSALIKHYLIPIMPTEFLHYCDKLELFEKRQRAWRCYTEQEALRAAASGHEEMKSKSIEAIMTLDEFLKYFETKHAKPRTLFPKFAEGKIEVERDASVLKSVKEARRELRKLIKHEYGSDTAIQMPIKDEPTALSELLKQIEEIQAKLIPVFKGIHKDSEMKDSESATKKSKKPKKKINITRSNVSILSRRSTVARSSTRVLKKTSKTSSSVADSAWEEMSTLNDSKENDNSNDNSKLVLIPHNRGKWTTKDIYEVSFDRATTTLSFYTGKYGVFAFPTRKYLHLPFKSWESHPLIEEGSERASMLRIETQLMTLEFKITIGGFTFKILKPGRVPIQEISKPIKLSDMKKLLISLNMNLFPEVDACHYIEGITEKHVPMEFHTYKTIASFCLLFHFKSDALNGIVDRRKTIINCKQLKRKEFKKILITPLRVQSIVAQSEEERGDAGTSSEQLPYKIEPLEQQFHPDPLSYLKEDFDRNEQRRNQKYFMAMWHMQALLQNLRPLSFSE